MILYDDGDEEDTTLLRSERWRFWLPSNVINETSIMSTISTELFLSHMKKAHAMEFKGNILFKSISDITSIDYLTLKKGIMGK